MFGNHLSYSLIKHGDKVLDIGGSAAPFRRANVVLDFLDYEKRNPNPSFLSGIPEHFTKQTWFVRDVCDSSKPFPFQDKEFDFVNCGHLLEDVRDPFFVIKEIQRVAKRGYLEVPTRFCEQLKWAEQRRICGFSHHRWFVDLKKNPQTQKNDLVFVFKNHSLHGKKDFQIRQPWYKFGRPRINPNFQYLSLYFNGSFDAYEDVSAAIDNGRSFMLETVKQAKNRGDEFWDAAAPVPVAMEDLSDLAPGIYNLQSLQNKVTQRIHLFDHKTGAVHTDVAQYEKGL